MTPMTRALRFSALLLLATAPIHANAAAVCEPGKSADEGAPTTAERIARIACEEHKLWKEPFITAQGRFGKVPPMEAEAREEDFLDDDVTPPWKRVTQYWNESDAIDSLVKDNTNGAKNCSENPVTRETIAMCRAFLLDNPWSAAFVSYVMKRAELPGFRFSASHIDYIRDAHANPQSPYRLVDPDKTKPVVGDLLCYVREGNPQFGFAGLTRHLAQGDDSLNTHCDIVVMASLNGDSKLYLIGGNVVQAVTMRKLSLNREGLVTLPRSSGKGEICRLDDERGCDLNRKDWAALLQLKSSN